MGYLLPDTPLLSVDEYVRERDGGAGIEAARALGSDGTIAELVAAGLRGRGGAGFPAGRTWESIRSGGADAGQR